MSILEDKMKEQLKNLLTGLPHPVRLLMFRQESDCQMCGTTAEMLTELAALSEKIELEIHDFVKDAELAKPYKIDKVPALAVIGEKDYGIRFYGIPAGYEFTTLVEDILMVGHRRHGLSAETLAELASVDQPAHLEVMVSPVCPYCPIAVKNAHRLAMANDFVSADMVESAEFPKIVELYKVSGVPHTVINGTYSFVGQENELETAREILRALGKLPPKPPAPPESALTKLGEALQKHLQERHHEHLHEPKSAKPKKPPEKPAAKPEEKGKRGKP